MSGDSVSCDCEECGVWACDAVLHSYASMHSIGGVPRNFFRGEGSSNSIEDREDGDLGAVAP